MNPDRLKIAAHIVEELMQLGWEPTPESVQRLTAVVVNGGPTGFTQHLTPEQGARRAMNLRRNAEVRSPNVLRNCETGSAPLLHDGRPCTNANGSSVHATNGMPEGHARKKIAGPFWAADPMRGTRESGPSEAASTRLDPILILQSCKDARTGG